MLGHSKTVAKCLPSMRRPYNGFSSKRFMLSSVQSVDDSAVSAKTSWQAQHNIDIQRVTQKAIIHELTQQQTSIIEKVVPWFLSNMPNSYFSQVPEQFRMDHIKAISAIRDANMDLHMNLKTHLPDDRLLLTYIRPGKESGRLLHLLKDLPWDHNTETYLPLSRVQVFKSSDESLSISMFVYGGESSSPLDVESAGVRILDYAEEKLREDDETGEHSEVPSHLYEKKGLIEYMRKCEETYITRSNPRRFLKQRELFEAVSGTECMAISIESETDGPPFWIDIAVANSLPQVALENASRILDQHKFDIIRSHLDMISDGDNGDVCLFRMLVTPLDGAPVTEDDLGAVIRELKRMKWMDPQTMDLVFSKYPWLGVRRGEIITAFCSLLHPIMAAENRYAFSKGNIFDSVTDKRFIKYAASIADLFLDKFNPQDPLNEDEFFTRRNDLISKISSDVEDSVARDLLLKMTDVVKDTLRTNLYLENRYSLGLRLDPVVMTNTDLSKETPYAVIFSHGRRFNAFHVRFRDIARGGMRLVTPSSPEQYALESARHYDECYGLAFAQQLKNKDIPEGGSKAVNLIDCNGLSDQAKQFVMRKSVKAFSNTILDLIVDTDETRERVVDYLGKKEVIYLGPDEQVTNDDIGWMVQRAQKRGYVNPSAFMSSKPRAGINHKEFGVTSEGINTFLDVALRRVLSIDPKKQEFTVKITGGPDGDVAGNEIKILLREYGDNAKIVGIADSSGCAEDPEGLNHDELMHLVCHDLSISNFNTSKLGPEGEIHLVDNEKGIKARNTMHNRLKADAFIPAGGRPNTIDINNYRNFVMSDGSPSSPLIVEGANLFITAEARQALYEEAGVVIVKDSSANKCGVITSSYEICAAMMLSEDEFFSRKEEIVREVLVKLRKLAKMEAELLFLEFDSSSDSLPNISHIISDTINSATDAIATALDTISKEEQDALLPLFREHLPQTLSELAFDRLHDRVPEQYIKNAIASCLASKMVYKEGTRFIQSLPKDKLASVALNYVSKEKEIAELSMSLSETNMPQSEKEAIIAILEKGGVRSALGM